MASNMKTTKDYISKYGFCNWQAQELLKRLSIAEEALKCVVEFTEMRKQELGYLSPELQAVEDKILSTLEKLNFEQI